MTGTDSLRAALRRLRESGATLMGEAVGVHGPTAGFADGPGLLRTPLGEAGTVGAAVGLAVSGRRVVVELVDGAGVARAAEALGEAARLVREGAGAWTIPLVVLAPASDDAVAASAAISLDCLIAGVADDVAPLLESAVSRGAPALLLVGRAALDGEVSGAAPAPSGPVIRRPGAAVTIAAVGDGVPASLAAVDNAGLDAEVVDLRSARVEGAALGESVRKTGRLVVVGAPASVLYAGTRDAFLHLESPPARAGVDPEAIVAAVRASLNY